LTEKLDIQCPPFDRDGKQVHWSNPSFKIRRSNLQFFAIKSFIKKLYRIQSIWNWFNVVPISTFFRMMSVDPLTPTCTASGNTHLGDGCIQYRSCRSGANRYGCDGCTWNVARLALADSFSFRTITDRRIIKIKFNETTTMIHHILFYLKK